MYWLQLALAINPIIVNINLFHDNYSLYNGNHQLIYGQQIC